MTERCPSGSGTGLSEVIKDSTAYLARHRVQSPRSKVEALLMQLLGTTRSGLYARRDGLDANTSAELQRALVRLRTGTPLQHLTGEQRFLELDLAVEPGVFVPRPETEVVAIAAVDAIRHIGRPVVVDVGTGTGAIALLVKARRPEAHVLATDRSPAAVALARRNAERLGLGVDVRHGDLLDPLPGELRGHLDLIVSNPPYLSEEEWAALPAEVKSDPREALVGGTEIHARLAEAARSWLSQDGLLVVEIGAEQEDEVGTLLRRSVHDVWALQDLAGRDRVVLGRRPIRPPPAGGPARRTARVLNFARTDAAAVAAAVQACASALLAGLLVVMPTDTVFGIACRADDPEATARLFEAKRRPVDLALPVLVPSASAAFEVAERSEDAAALAEAFWPGSLTLVLARTSGSAAWSLGRRHDSIAVRVPADPIASAVLARAGPVAASSANRSGEPPGETAEALVAAFGDLVSVYLVPDGDEVRGRAASTVLDLSSAPPLLLRRGPIGPDELRAAAPGLGAIGDSLD